MWCLQIVCGHKSKENYFHLSMVFQTLAMAQRFLQSESFKKEKEQKKRHTERFIVLNHTIFLQGEYFTGEREKEKKAWIILSEIIHTYIIMNAISRMEAEAFVYIYTHT